MTPQWLIPDKLCSFDEKVRVEIGPQIIELDCTDENLCNEVTHANYGIGKRDALGRLIRPDEFPDDPKNPKAKRLVKYAMGEDERLGVPSIKAGEKMACVDWRAKHVPHLWKIYQLQETDEIDREGNLVSRFIKVGEAEGRVDALARAKAVYEGMV